MIRKDGRQKRYSTEFKEETVARSNLVGSKQTSEELGIPAGTINRWKKELGNDSKVKIGKESSTKPSYEDLEKEVKKLKKELGYVNEINRVLKKSTAIFSNIQLKDLN